MTTQDHSGQIINKVEQKINLQDDQYTNGHIQQKLQQSTSNAGKQNTLTNQIEDQKYQQKQKAQQSQLKEKIEQQNKQSEIFQQDRKGQQEQSLNKKQNQKQLNEERNQQKEQIDQNKNEKSQQNSKQITNDNQIKDEENSKSQNVENIQSNELYNQQNETNYKNQINIDNENLQKDNRQVKENKQQGTLIIVKDSVAEIKQNKSKTLKKPLDLSKGFKPAQLKSLQKSQSISKNNKSPDNTSIYNIFKGKKILMSEQDIMKLKKLRLQNKRREQQIKKRIKTQEEMLQKIKNDQINQKQQKIIQKKQKRKDKIKQKQKTLSNEKQQRKQRLIEQNKKLKELKQSVKLYEKMELDFIKKQSQISAEQAKLKPPPPAPVLINFNQIKQHQRYYLTRSRQRIQKSQQKIKSRIKEIQEQYKSLNFHKSQFYQKVKEQKRKKTDQMQQITRLRRVYSEKVKQYKENVKQNFKPITQKPMIIVEKKKKIQSRDSKYIYEIGNQYMKQYKKNLERQKSLTQKRKRRADFQITVQMPLKTKSKKRNRTENKQNDQLNKKQSLLPEIKKSSENKSMTKNNGYVPDTKQKYMKLRLLQDRIEKQIKPNQKGMRLKLFQQTDGNK